MKGSNLAEFICRRHSDAVTRPALRERCLAGINTYTYGALDYLSNKFATCLISSGLASGDRVLIALPLSSELIVAHLGALKVGAVILPFSSLVRGSILLHGNQVKPRSVVTSHEQMETYQYRHQISEGTESTFVVTEIVSQNLSEIRLKSFWYEINFANPDHQFATVDSLSPAYILPSRADHSALTTEVVTHGEILDHIQVHENRGNQEQKLAWEMREGGEISRSDLTALYTRLCAGESIEV